jgi:hypothetical protein
MINLIQFRLATPIYDEHSKEYEEMIKDEEVYDANN